MHDTIEQAFKLATRVIFTADSTRTIFEELESQRQLPQPA